MCWYRWKFWRLAWSINPLGHIGSIVTFKPEGVWRPLPFCSRLVWFTPCDPTQLCDVIEYSYTKARQQWMRRN